MDGSQKVIILCRIITQNTVADRFRPYQYTHSKQQTFHRQNPQNGAWISKLHMWWIWIEWANVIGMAWALRQKSIGPPWPYYFIKLRSATDPSPRLGRPRTTSKQRSHIAQSDCHVSLELPSEKCEHKVLHVRSTRTKQQSEVIACHFFSGGGGMRWRLHFLLNRLSLQIDLNQGRSKRQCFT